MKGVKNILTQTKYRIILSGILMTVGLTTIGWLKIRQVILESKWNSIIQKIESKGYQLKAEKIGFSGFFTVAISNASLKIQDLPVAEIKKLEIKPDLLSLLTEKPKIKNLEIDDGLIYAIKKNGFCNYCKLLDSDNEIKIKDNTQKYPSTQYQQIVTLLSKVPTNIKLDNLKIQYQKHNQNYKALINKFKKNDGEFQGLLVFYEENITSKMKIKGSIDGDDLTGKIEIYPYANQNDKLKIPVLEKRFGLNCLMEKATLRIISFINKKNTLSYEIEGSAQGLELIHPKLSERKIVIRNLKGDIQGKIGENVFEIDSSTNILVNDLEAQIYLKWVRGDNDKIALQLKTHKTQAENFISSLPEGSFENLKGIKARGKLSWFLKLNFDSKKPEQCQFISGMNDDGFQITKMGKTNLAKINQPFLHTVSVDGKPIRSFIVGPANPNYTPIDAIPFSMQQAVMYSEDAGFYGHKGFYLSAFRESIIQNFKKGKFARGGSTISMQLVKNVFLNPRKTLTRKAEEIFITWIIENENISSKKRMMEVYLNVIEFGNNIWGIGEASRHYFGKHPSQLTNKESVFIASLVPRPRVYQYLIQNDGSVSPNNWNFTAIQNRFIKKGIMSSEDTTRYLPGLKTKFRPNFPTEIEEEIPNQIDLEIFD